MSEILQSPIVQGVVGVIGLALGVFIIYRAMVQRDRERGR